MLRKGFSRDIYTHCWFFFCFVLFVCLFVFFFFVLFCFFSLFFGGVRIEGGAGAETGGNVQTFLRFLIIMLLLKKILKKQ